MRKKILPVLLSAIIGLSLSLPVSAPTVMAANGPYVQSDTTVDFARPRGLTYQVKFTVHGTHVDPHIAAGNGAVLRTENTVKKVENGNDTYYFKVRAAGKVGQTSAIYTTLPGQKAIRHFTMRVGTPISNAISVTQSAGTVRHGCYATLSIKGKPKTSYAIAIYYDSGSSVAKKLDTKVSDSSGNVSWTWKVGTKTHAGSHNIVVTGGGQQLKTSFVTT